MATVTIDGKVYITTGRKMTPVVSKAQQNKTALPGPTIIQNFNVNPRRWSFEILVWRPGNEPSASHGDVDDLIAAYNKTYVTFIDNRGVNQGSVIFEGELQLPEEWSIISATMPFIVKLNLTKRRT